MARFNEFQFFYGPKVSEDKPMFTRKQPEPTTVTRIFSPLLYLVFTMLLILLIDKTSATATDIYSIVSDNSEVTLKSGHGDEYRKIGQLQNGETVTSLEDRGDWVKIRTATGRQGWILKKYLSNASTIDEVFSLPIESQQPEKPATAATPVDKQPDKALATPTPEDTKLNKAPTIPAPENKQPLNSSQPEMNVALPSQPAMVKATANNEPETELEELKTKLAMTMLENKKLREDERIKWFLTGGGVLFIGWIIGLITCRSRKRKPSLL